MNTTNEIPNIARQLGLNAAALSAATAAAAPDDLAQRIERTKALAGKAAEVHRRRSEREAIARRLGVDPEQLHQAAARDLAAEIEAETQSAISARLPGARYTRTG